MMTKILVSYLLHFTVKILFQTLILWLTYCMFQLIVLETDGPKNILRKVH
jgi:hypothetical protein